MAEYRYLRGTVYILENADAQRVKVGTTINQADSRLNDANNMWRGRKVTCQICGGRLFSRQGIVPAHPQNSPRQCFGGNAPPIERDVTLAESHLEDLKRRIGDLSGSEKGSVTRIISNLEKRIEIYRNYRHPTGIWIVRVTFNTEAAEKVELVTHEILGQHLDTEAPFGEVFRCSVSEAAEAVESALATLGLSARRVTLF